MDKRFEKILIAAMICAALALPILYNADTYALIDDGLIGTDGIINEYPGIMRLHIIANSDSEEDQALKLVVRNYILAKVQNELVDDNEARTYILENLPQIEEWAQEVLDASETAYEARAHVSIRHIPAKYYDELFFPEGNYEALTITLGEGDGQNWWCVVFPPLCLVDGSGSMEGQEFETGEGDTLVLKSRIAEILEAAQEPKGELTGIFASILSSTSMINGEA